MNIERFFRHRLKSERLAVDESELVAIADQCSPLEKDAVLLAAKLIVEAREALELAAIANVRDDLPALLQFDRFGEVRTKR